MSKKRSSSVPNIATFKSIPIKIPIRRKLNKKNTNNDYKMNKIEMVDFLNPAEIVKVNKLEKIRFQLYGNFKKLDTEKKILENKIKETFKQINMINEKIDKILDPDEIFSMDDYN
jgi:hypothetical protein